MSEQFRRLAAVATGIVALAVVAPGTATAAPATGAVIGLDDPNAIAGRYIVETVDGPSAAGVTASLADEYDADVTRVYEAAFTGFAAALDPDDARALAADPAVAAVYADGVVTAPSSVDTDAVQTDPPPNLDRMDEIDSSLDGLYTYPDTAGSGRTVHIIDTGVDASHPDFGTRVDPGWDVVDGDGDASDCNGHGTGLAGIVAGTEHGVAKLARVVPVRALDCNGSGTYSGVLEAIEWVVQDVDGGVGTALMAIGGGPSAPINDAVAAAVASGVSMVVAAGASASDACGGSPAMVPEAMTVAGLNTDTDDSAPWSNYGPCVDLWAPATDITLPWPGGGTSTVSGSSFGAAHVAGALALYLGENPGHTAAQAEAALMANAVDSADALPRVCIAFLNS